jgi:uncharacterized RDD family membrane protein YckC
LASSLSASPEGVGFGARLGAFALDAMLVFVTAGPLVALTGRAGAVVFFLVAPALATLFCWHRYGATPGKIAFSARIVDARSGERPTIARLAGRSLAYIISAAPLLLGFAWIAIDRRKQAWHDKIAGTRVVYDDD